MHRHAVVLRFSNGLMHFAYRLLAGLSGSLSEASSALMRANAWPGKPEASTSAERPQSTNRRLSSRNVRIKLRLPERHV